MSVLAPLLEAARARARHDARITPIAELRRQVAAMPAAPRFEAALRYADRLAIVAEVKRRSPSAGEFASVADGPRRWPRSPALRRRRSSSALDPDRADALRWV